ncbi:hypothetical protein IDM40_05175 [Nocardiopsis sp. HNM0947]|uniref:Uncharacterized protein n=1 Tax=Nocardiopsis coralli TaxID=2772213 RepID=A0ABR9P2Y1_9ACTN|nr:hypothetical protein [Nocardiopsis coralli]MBE2998100.1 hypothetical protein [Nocardiopsis coralli]
MGLVYVRRLWPLLVSITVPLAFAAPPAALLLSFPGHVIANGLPVLLDDPDAWRIVARGVLTVAALAGAAVGLGAAVTLGSAALMGRDVPVAAAWRIGLRRLRTLVVWTAGTGALTAATLWTGMVRFTESDIPPPFAMLVLLPPYLLLMAVWCVALSAALLEGRGLVDAVRRAWELGTTRRTSHAVLTSACVATAVLAVTGTEIAVGAIVGSGGDQLLALAARGALLTLAVPLVLLLLCAPGVHASPDSPWYLDLARVDRRLTAAGNTVWPVPRATVPVLAVAVALPTVAPPLATALSPNITPQLVSEPLDLDGADAGQMTISEDGTTVHFGDDLDTAELRETHGVADQYRSAPAPLENGVVVTTYVDPHHRMEEEGPDHLDGLRAHVCEDAACTDPREVDLDEELEQTDRFHRDEHARGGHGAGRGCLTRRWLFRDGAGTGLRILHLDPLCRHRLLGPGDH